MSELAKRRALYELGQRAIDYYVDTGFCVFCEADDCAGVPHEDHCNVGVLSAVTVDEARLAKKMEQRTLLDVMLLRGVE